MHPDEPVPPSIDDPAVPRGKRYHVVVSLGLAKAGFGDEEALIEDLQRVVHAAAIDRYGDHPGCAYSGFSPAFGGRDEFAEELDICDVVPDRYLAEWDAYAAVGLALAVVHWWPFEPHLPAAPGAGDRIH